MGRAADRVHVMTAGDESTRFIDPAGAVLNPCRRSLLEAEMPVYDALDDGCGTRVAATARSRVAT
jgi:hypothetical protein